MNSAMPGDLSQLLSAAARLRASGADAEAVMAYQQLLTLSPGLPAAQQALWEMFYHSGDSHLQAQNFDEAAYFAGLALTLEPNHAATALLAASAWLSQGVARFALGKIDESEALLRQSRYLCPGLAGVDKVLANVLAARALQLSDQGQLDLAAELFREAAQICPADDLVRHNLFRLLINRAIIFYNDNQFPEALVPAAEGLAMEPDSAWAIDIHAKIALQAQGNWIPVAEGPMVVPYLEMDISYACNLHCDGCTHYSDYSVKGHVEFETGRDWLQRWSARITPKLFRLVGGEPTLNPRLVDYIRFAHRLWPLSIREVVSNGFYLDRHPGLFEALGETKTALQISVHEESTAYLNKVRLDKLKEASRQFGFALHAHYGTEDDFYRLYKGKGSAMRPYDDKQPAKSMAVCGNAGCSTLHLGRLWKCPPIAFLNNIEKKFHLAEVPAWQPYLQHKGLGLDASHEEIRDYLAPPQYFCAMCPATRQGGSNRTNYAL